MRPKCYDPSRPDIYMMSVYLARRSSGGMGCASGARDMRTPACGLFLSLVLEILLDSARLSVNVAPVENPSLQGGDVVRLGDRKPADWADSVPSANHPDALGRLTSGLQKSINCGFSKFGTASPAYQE